MTERKDAYQQRKRGILQCIMPHVQRWICDAYHFRYDWAVEAGSEEEGRAIDRLENGGIEKVVTLRSFGKVSWVAADFISLFLQEGSVFFRKSRILKLNGREDKFLP